MTQFEKALINLSDLINEGKVVAVGETPSYLATIYFISQNSDDKYMYITFYQGEYEGVNECTFEDYKDHYDEAKAESVEIWESEGNDK